MLKIIKNSDESIEMEDASDLNENILLCDFNNSISTKTTKNHNNDLNYYEKSKNGPPILINALLTGPHTLKISK